MKKVFTMVFLALFTVFSSACSLSASGDENHRTNLLNKQTEDDLAQTRLVQIFDTIVAQDKDSIKSLFSPYAQEGSERLDDAIEYLFSYVDGNIESWK